MIDLTPYLTAEVQRKIGRLQMSERAAEQLEAILRSHDVAEFCTPARFAPIVAKSAASLLTSDYFAHSAWFQRQPVHAVGICLINTGSEQYAPIFHVAGSRSAGHVVSTPDEHPLPDDYFEQRLIAEVRVENGISDAEDRRNECTP